MYIKKQQLICISSVNRMYKGLKSKYYFNISTDQRPKRNHLQCRNIVCCGPPLDTDAFQKYWCLSGAEPGQLEGALLSTEIYLCAVAPVAGVGKYSGLSLGLGSRAGWRSNDGRYPSDSQASSTTKSPHSSGSTHPLSLHLTRLNRTYRKCLERKHELHSKHLGLCN